MEQLLGEVFLDSKKRLSMGRLLKNINISSFGVYQTEDGLLLKPKVSIPLQELWVFENSKVKKSLSKGLSQTPKHNLGSFSKYLKED